MGFIRVLPEEVAQKIAAGEVVERPASVVKELVENALDAGATSIIIELEEGGKKLIQVTDNGIGVPKEDLPLTVHPHATSKIKDLSDLQSLASFGFRGEALASIAAVSRLYIHSRYKESKVGYLFDATAGKISPKPRDIGTTVTVKDLFYNTPARRKFMRSEKTELKHILETVYSLALSNLETTFKVIHNQKEVFFVSASASLKERLAEMFEFNSKDLVEVHPKGTNIQIKAVFVKPQNAFSFPKFFRVYVNDRVVEDPMLKKAVLDALAPFVLDSKQVKGVVKVYVPPSWVDFNVHPQKIQVRFANPFRVRFLVEKLLSKELATALKDSMLGPFVDTKGQGAATVVGGASQSSEVYLPSASLQTQAAAALGAIKPYYMQTTKDKGTKSQIMKLPGGGFTPGVGNKTEELDPARVSIVKIVPLLNRYILVEFTDKIWLIDQHAAAERIRFEELGGGEQIFASMQTFGVPITLNVGKLTNAEDFINFLEQVGIKAKYQNGKLVVTGALHFIKPKQVPKVVEEALEVFESGQPASLEQGTDPAKDIYRYIVATRACHSAIRANEPLTQEMAQDLVYRLLRCKNPFFCPHGRPVVWELTPEKIDKAFLRT